MHSHNHMIKISRDITTVSPLVYQQTVTQLITNNVSLCALSKTTANYIYKSSNVNSRVLVISMQ